MSDLTVLANDIYDWAIEKGFYDPVDEAHLDLAISLLRHISTQTNSIERARGKSTFGQIYVPQNNDQSYKLGPDEKVSALKLILMISEIIETFEEIIKGDRVAETEEVADIIIRLLDYAGFRDMDIEAAVLAKMEKNTKRPYKHGKNF